MGKRSQDGLVSVIIPVYNVELYLNRCIGSVVQQSYENLEIICINDGSTDRSPDICREWMGRDGRIRVIEKVNEGLGPARNDGVRAANGEYLLFVDSDDWIHESCVELLYQKALECAADVVIYDYFLTTYEEGLERYRHRSGRRFFDLKGEIVKLEDYPALLSRAGGTVWNKFQRTEFVRQYGLYQPAHPYEDIGYVYGLLASAGRIAQVKKELYYYWINRKDSITNQAPHLEACKLALLEMRQALEGRNAYDKYHPFLECYSARYYQISLKRLNGEEGEVLSGCKQYYYEMYPKAWEIDSAAFLLVGDSQLQCIMERIRYLNMEPSRLYSHSEFMETAQAACRGVKYALLDLGSLMQGRSSAEEGLAVVKEVLGQLQAVDGLERIFVLETTKALGTGLYGLLDRYEDSESRIRENTQIHLVFEQLRDCCGSFVLVDGPEEDKLYADDSLQQPLNHYWYYDVADRIRGYL